MDDNELLEIYMWGFEDELKGIFDSSSFTNKLKKRAYELGRTDAILGDDLSHVDLKTGSEILFEIKNK